MGSTMAILAVGSTDACADWLQNIVPQSVDLEKAVKTGLCQVVGQK